MTVPKRPQVRNAMETVVIAVRASAVDNLRRALPNEMCFEVMRFLTTGELGRLGRTGSAVRALSLQWLTQLPGDYRLSRMLPPDRRVYFRSDAHRRAQWEKPTRALPPPLFERTGSVWFCQVSAPLPSFNEQPPGDYTAMESCDRRTYWVSDGLYATQWERPCYGDLPDICQYHRRSDRHGFREGELVIISSRGAY